MKLLRLNMMQPGLNLRLSISWRPLLRLVMMNAASEIAHFMEDTAETPEEETDAAKFKTEVVDLTENTAETLEDETDAAKVELEVADFMDAFKNRY